MTGVYKRERRGRLGHRDTQERRPWDDGRRDWSYLPQGKEHMRPLGAGRGKEAFSPRALRGSVALHTA